MIVSKVCIAYSFENGQMLFLPKSITIPSGVQLHINFTIFFFYIFFFL